METQQDAVNLGDEEIVKSTQFSMGDCVGSQVQQNVEARVIYGSSQPGTYSLVPGRPESFMRPQAFSQSQDMRCPSLSSISYGHQGVWPNYGPGYGSGVHPMQQLVGSAMYLPFPMGTFGGMSPTYLGVSQGGPLNNFHMSQLGQVEGVRPIGDWQSLRNTTSTVQAGRERATGDGRGDRIEDPTPLCTRLPSTSEGMWFCPPSKLIEREGRLKGFGEEGHFVSTGGTRGDSMEHGRRSPEASELRQSPPPDSTKTQRGPLPSASADVDHNSGPSMKHKDESTIMATSKSTCSLQARGDINSSKYRTPDSLNKRKALREDERSYLREVRMAISEGRVPQVNVVQDEDGNIVRYKCQFMNALKLAAHAVVQDAYININKQETMKEILEEVGRQFVLQRPLPVRMVEEYLKGYFKRCRYEYHKFWMKHGDKKRPDGCKLAAWLQLIDFWRSAEGSKECNQNKVNATPMKSKVKSKVLMMDELKQHVKVKANVECDDEADEKLHATKTAAAIPVGRNAMADISNQLHNAVDSILSCFASRCEALPSCHMKSVEGIQPMQVVGIGNVRGLTAVTRTAAEVLGRVQRPLMTEEDDKQRRSFVSSRPNVVSAVVKDRYIGVHGTAETSTKQVDSTLLTKISANDVCNAEAFILSESLQEQGDPSTCNAHTNVLPTKVEQVLLSSDASSDGGELTRPATAKGKAADSVVLSSKKAFAEEIEGWPCEGNANASLAKSSAGDRTGEGNNKRKMRQSEMEKSWNWGKQAIEDGKEPRLRLRRPGSINGTSPRNALKTFREAAMETKDDTDSGCEAANEESGEFNEKFNLGSEEEEPPVLPREVVKRKLDSEYGGSSSRKIVKEKNTTRCSKTPTKKQRVTEIDTSVLKKLEFHRRPKNANPIKTRTRVWILHPKFVGRVVAEGHAGVNCKSRCVDSANEICREGQQMISVVRVLYKNTPVMFNAESRFPKHISYLDQAEGLPNSPILWCVSHLMEVPPFDQITKLMGQLMKPLSQ